MSNSPRMTLQIQAVLRALLGEPGRERYGLELCEETGLPSGTVYPILARLEQIGWVESRWEDPDAHVSEGRPRRRYYRMTTDGAELGREAVAKAYRSRRQPLPAWLPRPGTAGGTS
ncbi:PadR family transcriptional regulator [Sphaerisporangium fuscum]|uniref:PadR family transcriptional regulator n=1 Tax=Sphaerisporangium fuscum TaxID=2835868 RepID=UPI002029B209|nr:helix-turn-helix transcriptional regulator [Sphaerisporangium fuscum]